MKSFTKRLCNFSLQSAKIIILALSLLLFGTAFFTSAYAYMDTQQMIFAWDNLLLSLISIIASLGLIFLLTNLSYKQKYIKHSLLIFVMILYALSTLILIVFLFILLSASDWFDCILWNSVAHLESGSRRCNRISFY